MSSILFESVPITIINKLGEIKTSKFPFDSDYKKTLGLLFPACKDYYQQKDDTLTISLVPGGALWPDTEVMKDLLFDDFEGAIESARDKFSLDKIDIIDSADVEEDSLISNKLIVDLFEFYLLFEAVVNGKREDSAIVMISLGPGNHIAFLTDTSTSIKEISKNNPLLGKILKDSTDIRVYHPLKKVYTEVDDPIGVPGIHHLVLSNSGLSVGPKSSILFPYPQFDRKFCLLETGSCGCSAECINCLAYVENCPAGLHPNYLYHNLEKDNPTEAYELNMKACRRCGKCSLVCPSNLPLYRLINEVLDSEDEE